MKKMHNLFYPLFFLSLIFNGLILLSPLKAETEQRKKAMIFGVTGQDGTYLTDFLLNKNYEVHGIARHVSPDKETIKKSVNDPNFFFHFADITNSSAIIELIGSIQPNEIYNLAAQSNVKTSFDFPEATTKINALGTLRLLEAVRLLHLEGKVKYFQASSSELFGLVEESPQSEVTPFHPRSPYGVAKLYAYWITLNYKEAYGLFACNGILFNHESPLRGEAFVTRKITLAACRYKLGLQDVLCLGNLDAKRDWGYAKDYVEAMWLMLQQDIPDNFVIATGETHSVRELVELALLELGIPIEWQGEGINEQGVNGSTGEIIVKIDPQYYRPNDGGYLVGNAEKAEKILKWKPKTSVTELVKIMVKADYEKALKESLKSVHN